jgi:hypothetical protein
MLANSSWVQSAAFFPTNSFEWQETAEYLGILGFSSFGGYLIANFLSELKRRLGPQA